MSICLSVPARNFSRFPQVSPQVAQVGKRGNDRIRMDQPTPVITVDYFNKHQTNSHFPQAEYL